VSRTFGIQLTTGNATTRADVTVSGNKVRNVTAHGIVLREIAGAALVKDNDIDIGSVGGVNTNLPDNFVDAIMVQGAKPLVYTVTDNIINCGYENSAGIRLQSTTAEPIKQATISRNQIKMSMPAGAVGGEESAGIELRRNCEANNVSDNTVKGQARAVLAVLAGIVGTTNLVPKLNTFTNNTHANFTATKADVLVGPVVDGTTVSSSTGGTKLTAGSLNTNVSPNYQEI